MYQLEILRYGSKGDLVKVWQEFLIGENLYNLRIDGDFGPGTKTGTQKFERQHDLIDDGIVDDELWGYAMASGLVLSGSRYDFPDKPDFSSMSSSERNEKFGEIQYVPQPVPGNREGIRIINNWNGRYLTKVVIPQLRGVIGAPADGAIFWNKKGVDQIRGFFNQVEKEGLKDRVLTWSGSWAPRFIRNRPGTLSSHSWASAFDINYTWNRLGRTPAPMGKRGCVHELVPIANQWGFFWGGFFGRPDGMHFELAYVK
jgi:peptidoglycan hydrolase-like protein with peptidoglycan-binding domain